jgi:hypothetical protein
MKKGYIRYIEGKDPRYVEHQKTRLLNNGIKEEDILIEARPCAPTSLEESRLPDLIKQLKSGDELHIYSLSMLGLEVHMLTELIKYFEASKIKLYVCEGASLSNFELFETFSKQRLSTIIEVISETVADYIQELANKNMVLRKHGMFLDFKIQTDFNSYRAIKEVQELARNKQKFKINDIFGKYNISVDKITQRVYKNGKLSPKGERFIHFHENLIRDDSQRTQQ